MVFVNVFCKINTVFSLHKIQNLSKISTMDELDSDNQETIDGYLVP